MEEWFIQIGIGCILAGGIALLADFVTAWQQKRLSPASLIASPVLVLIGMIVLQGPEAKNLLTIFAIFGLLQMAILCIFTGIWWTRPTDSAVIPQKRST